uniref:Uncharacterized protein n=1 Tax=Oryza nivara TaxID=4536 RepID=A0A0E0I6X1_ORYNI
MAVPTVKPPPEASSKSQASATSLSRRVPNTNGWPRVKGKHPHRRRLSACLCPILANLRGIDVPIDGPKGGHGAHNCIGSASSSFLAAMGRRKFVSPS